MTRAYQNKAWRYLSIWTVGAGLFGIGSLGISNTSAQEQDFLQVRYQDEGESKEKGRTPAVIRLMPTRSAKLEIPVEENPMEKPATLDETPDGTGEEIPATTSEVAKANEPIAPATTPTGFQASIVQFENKRTGASFSVDIVNHGQALENVRIIFQVPDHCELIEPSEGVTISEDGKAEYLLGAIGSESVQAVRFAFSDQLTRSLPLEVVSSIPLVAQIAEEELSAKEPTPEKEMETETEEGEEVAAEDLLDVQVTGPESTSLGSTVLFKIHIENRSGRDLGPIQMQANLPPEVQIEGRRKVTMATSLPAKFQKDFVYAVRAIDIGTHELSFEILEQEKTIGKDSVSLVVSKPAAEVQIVGPSQVQVHQEATYAVEIINKNALPFEDVDVEVALPEGFQVTVTEHEVAYDKSTHVMRWKVKSVDAKSKVVLRYKGKSGAAGLAVQDLTVTCEEVESKHQLGTEIVAPPATKAKTAARTNNRTATAQPLRDPEVPRPPKPTQTRHE